MLSPELGLLPARHSFRLAAASVRTLTHIWTTWPGGALRPRQCHVFVGNSFFFEGDGTAGPNKVVAQAPGGLGMTTRLLRV